MSADDLRAAVEALRDEWANGQAVGYDRNEQVELDTEKAHARTLTALLAEHPAACEICLRAGCRGECRDSVPEPTSESRPNNCCDFHRYVADGWCYDEHPAPERDCNGGALGSSCECATASDCPATPEPPSGGEVTADELARTIWHTSRADESTISATGANHVAAAILARYDVRERP